MERANRSVRFCDYCLGRECLDPLGDCPGTLSGSVRHFSDMNLPIPVFVDTNSMPVRVESPSSDKFVMIKVPLCSPWVAKVIKICNTKDEAMQMSRKINVRLQNTVDSLVFVQDMKSKEYWVKCI